MPESDDSITITAEQLKELQAKLSHMRHEINNQLSMVVAALELLRFRPEMQDKMLDTIGAQSPKISAEMMAFSREFEAVFGPNRD